MSMPDQQPTHDESPQSLQLQGGALRLAARAWGPPHGTPVIALHGWLDNAASFDALAPHLPGLRLVALDLPGHGHSAHRPEGCGYHFIDYVGDVLAAADALGWDRFALLGHSLGGAIATLLAGTCPERVERLALIEALGPMTDDPARAPARLAGALARAREGARREAPVYADIEAAIEARCKAGALTREAARPLVERGTITSEDGLRWRADRRLRLPSPYRLTEEQALAFLGAIDAPTRVVRAENGLLNPAETVIRERLARLRNARMHALPGHHHIHLEDPAPVAEILLPFLAADGHR